MAESLKDIVEAALFQLGSSREFEREATRRGHNLTHTTINAIRNGTHGGTFRPGTLDAIAAVSGVSRKRVYAAANLPLPGKRFADELPEDVDYLDRQSRNAVIGVVKALLDLQAPTRFQPTPGQMSFGLAANAPGTDPGTEIEDGQP